ncbi:hypothetical protein ACA910_001160 [Epithemia clementina (nom. ined.)]
MRRRFLFLFLALLTTRTDSIVAAADPVNAANHHHHHHDDDNNNKYQDRPFPPPRHPRHPDHRILHRALQQGTLLNVLDIKLAGPDCGDPDETDHRLRVICQAMGSGGNNDQEACATTPTRIFPHAGPLYEADHIQFGLPCWYRTHISVTTTPKNDDADDDAETNPESDTPSPPPPPPPRLPGQAAFEASFQLAQAMEDDETLLQMVETWSPCIQPQLTELSPAEQAQLAQQHRGQSRNAAHYWRRRRRRRMEDAIHDPDHAEDYYRPNDPLLSEQTAYDAIRLYEAWDLVSRAGKWGRNGTRQVIVHMLDSGWDVEHHPDLGDNAWTNYRESGCDNGIDNDYNGYIDDCHGWSFEYGNQTLMSNASHGTVVAGLLAANNDNNIGVAGVAGGLKGELGISLMVTSSIFQSEQGMVYAADHGAHISSNSWGYGDSPLFPNSMKAAIDYALAKNVLIVFAAGNYGMAGSIPSYPAAYEPVIAVGATYDDGVAAEFTTYGEWLNISAPGVELLSTFPISLEGTYYGRKSGTSFSTPLVSAVLALGKAMKPEASNAELTACLYASAANIEHVQKDDKYLGKLGKGMLDAPAFLKCLTEEGCGNSIVEDGEVCDSNRLGVNENKRCEDYGYDVGRGIRCSSDCQSFDFSYCYSIIMEESELSGTAGSETRFTVDIDFKDLTEIRFELSMANGSTYADVDLFVSRDYPPTMNQNDCHSVSLESDELCTDTRPGIYHILVKGHTDFSNANLLVMTNGVPKLPGCGNSFLDAGELCDGNNMRGQTCLDLGLDGGELVCGSDCQHYDTSKCYDMYVNETLPFIIQGAMAQQMVEINNLVNITAIEFRLEPGDGYFYGDADLYVRKNAEPTLNDFDCASLNIGSNELCTFTEPGTYYIMVYGFTSFNNIVGTVVAYGKPGPPTPAPTESVAPSATPTASLQPSSSSAPSASGFCRPGCTACYTRQHRLAGCAKCPECQSLVCSSSNGGDSYCCTTHWDETCGQRAQQLCPCEANDGETTITSGGADSVLLQ